MGARQNLSTVAGSFQNNVTETELYARARAHTGSFEILKHKTKTET